MQKDLHKQVTLSLNKILKTDEASRDGAYTGFGTDISTMMLKCKLDADEVDKNDHQRLERILSYYPFLVFFRITADDDNDLLTDEAQTYLESIFMFFKSTCEQLSEGSITLELLETILAVYSKDNFFFLRLYQTAHPWIRDCHLTRLLEIRESEKETYFKEKRLNSNFVNQELFGNVNVKEIENKVEVLSSQLKLNETCLPVPLSKITRNELPSPFSIDCTYFSHSDEVQKMLEACDSARESEMYIAHLQNEAQEVRREIKQTTNTTVQTPFIELSIEDVAIKVWIPVHKKLQNLVTEIERGEISMETIESNLGHLKDVSRMEFLQNIEKLFNVCGSSTHALLDTRCQQILTYFSLKKGELSPLTTKILELKEEFQLHGDFSELKLLDILPTDEGKTESLNSINDRLIRLKKELEKMESEHQFDIYVELKETLSKGLTAWTRREIDDINQLEVFMDLAAGDSDAEFQCVMSFHHAITGFAPFIFDLKTDSSLRKFIEVTKQLTDANKIDIVLITQWKEIKQNLSKLEQVKKAMHSSPLQQAEAINAKGVYYIGNFKMDDGQLQSHSTSEACNFKLKVDDKVHYLKDLQDLQSKLSLVVGKVQQDSKGGRAQMEYFIEVFNAMQQLSSTHEKLCSAGNTLFLDWKAEFYCDMSETRVEKTVCMDFGVSKDKCLYGTRALRKELPSLLRFMDRCLTRWQDHVSNKRMQHYYLNYYTTGQLLRLCHDLACSTQKKAKEGNKTQKLALLSRVSQESTWDTLESLILSAMDAATKEILQSQLSGNEGDDSDKRAAELQHANMLATQIAKENDLTETLVLAAIHELGTDKGEEDYVTWCMEHPAGKKNTKPIHSVTTSWTKIVSDLLEELLKLESALDKRLDVLWDKYLQSVKCVDSDEYLSLDYLGLILKHLALLGKGHTITERKFPTYLKEGQPNLLICSTRDVLSTVLSIYHGGILPTFEEILICSNETTLEEVSLLWRRAVGDASRQNIFCLVHAERLEYHTSEKAGNLLTELLQKATRCRLVVVCSSEEEGNSHLVTKLDQFRTDSPMDIVKKYDIPKYILQQFQQRTKRAKNPAACITSNRSTAHVVVSDRSGVGKTTVVNEFDRALKNHLGVNARCSLCITIPLHDISVNKDAVVKAFLPHLYASDDIHPRIFHLDVAPMVHVGLDDLLFNLLVIGSLQNKHGYVWKCNPQDLYVVEMTDFCLAQNRRKLRSEGSLPCLHMLLPQIICHSPSDVMKEVLKDSSTAEDQHDWQECDPRIQERIFEEPFIQISYKYVSKFMNKEDLSEYISTDDKIRESHVSMLEVLLKNCGINNPSWSELCHFCRFLSAQLIDAEKCDYCSKAVIDADDRFKDFKQFVIELMLLMAQDFSTPSLNITDTSQGNLRTQRTLVDIPTTSSDEQLPVELSPYQLKRRWEDSPHPYIFFNDDRHSVTFMGFAVDDSGCLRNTLYQRRKVYIPIPLKTVLENQGVNLNEEFDKLGRKAKLEVLSRVLGVSFSYDPDPSYKLTADNVMKMLAIHMRFRCHIPVVIMGETGCGKTRLIQFMCRLLAAKTPNADETLTIQNMILMKIHGGTTEKTIEEKVELAEKIAIENKQNHEVDTVLFFDEANTTEAVGFIKEVMCDRRIQGRPLNAVGSGALKLIAACNPYKRHSSEMIQRLQTSGLGYNVPAAKAESFGSIPLRELVYRVHPLPPSILPLVWDFGNLNNEIEGLYITQIVLDYERNGKVKANMQECKIIELVLKRAQRFMKKQKNECSFVSLRDVKRCMDVLAWFLDHQFDVLQHTIIEHQDSCSGISDGEPDRQEEYIEQENDEEPSSSDSSVINQAKQQLTPVTKALVLALGVCYHARLQKGRDMFRVDVAEEFTWPCILPEGAHSILTEITEWQTMFVKDIDLGPNIARNSALMENVFMMVICIELRIPLFLVGKPGSSKSLAKTIVAKAMQGVHSKSNIFKNLKQVRMLSYQCSPHSTPTEIEGVFQRCTQFQKGKNLDVVVSVAVLDEVGLAEDSPKMPLKTLHPLLEVSSLEDEIIQKDRVAFIGLSNWALDPAKMNRGIMVYREDFSEKELVATARGICHSDQSVLELIEDIIPMLAKAYERVCESQEEREFFGLRDFYSLIKMVFTFAKISGKRPTENEIVHCIRRNFDGMAGTDKPEEIFQKCLLFAELKTSTFDGPDSSPTGLLKASMEGSPKLTGETCDKYSDSRYLLVLTENYAALPILQEHLLVKEEAVVIFGSSFPNDQKYTQICRDINRIKICMETGRTIVLLNLENLYESLYDALNQYYSYMKDQRYVALGLGTLKVRCQVNQTFRLIVIADKTVVEEDFPPPLKNRLEKHFVATSTMLSEAELKVVNNLQQNFVEKFSCVAFSDTTEESRFEKGDAFVGYHDDMIAMLVFQVCNKLNCHDGDSQWEDKVFNEVKYLLLRCATPEAILRLPHSKLADQYDELFDVYFRQQKHESLSDYLNANLSKDSDLLLQITTHSRLLVAEDIQKIARDLNLRPDCLQSLYVKSLQTQQQCRDEIRKFFTTNKNCTRLLLVQCEDGHHNKRLIAEVSYCILDERAQAKIGSRNQQMTDNSVTPVAHVIFIVNLARMSYGFTSLPGNPWESVHIDDVRPPRANRPGISSLLGVDMSSLLKTTSGESAISTDQLLMDCLHPALSRIRYSAESSGRIIQCLSDLHLIMTKDTEKERAKNTFTSIVKERIASLLEQKQQLQQDSEKTQWLSENALALSSIEESGTFRRSIWQQLVTNVTPLLAEVFAFCDYNDNLTILKEEPEDSWKHQLWLTILKDPQLCQLNYTDFLPQLHHRAKVKTSMKTAAKDIREKAPVRIPGCDGRPFSAELPFSWLIKDYMDRTYAEAVESKATQDLPLPDFFKQSVSKSALGTSIEACIPSENNEEFLNAYISDYTRMKYATASFDERDVREEIKCVVEAVKSAVEEKRQELDLPIANDHIQGLVLVHMAYPERRLQHFAGLVRMCPELITKECAQKMTKHGNEFILDVEAAEVLIKDFLTPSKDERTKLSEQKRWLQKVQRVKVMLQNLFHSVLQNQDKIYGKQSIQMITKVRPVWRRIRVLELFYSYVCLPLSALDERFSQQGNKVWNSFARGTDLKNVEEIIRLQTVLRTISDTASTLDVKSEMKCSICLEEPEDIPVILPCKHVLCETCLNEMLARGTRKICPVCRKEIPRDSWTDLSERRRIHEKYTAFKNYRSTFFFEIVSQLCFEDNTPPMEEVVKGLLNFVTKQQKTKQSETTTVDFDEDCIDPNTRIRSVILLLLLQSDVRKTQTFIDEYLSENQNEHQMLPAKDIINVCLMYIFCREDCFFRQASQNSDPVEGLLRESSDNLGNAQKYLANEGAITNINVALLESIAQARFGLTVTTQFLDEIKTPAKENVENLLDKARLFCQETSCIKKEAHFFLLKQFCKSYDVNALEDICRKQTHSWIFTQEISEKLLQIPDMLVVYGACYTSLRDALYLTMQQRNLEIFRKANTDAIECTQCSQNEKAVFLLMAMFRELTLYAKPRRLTDKELQQVIRPLPAVQKETITDIARRIIHNNLWGLGNRQLVATLEQPRDYKKMLVVIVHTMVVFTCSCDDFLRTPLRTLLLAPRKMQDSLLVTEEISRSSNDTVISGLLLRIIVNSLCLGSSIDNPRAIGSMLPPNLMSDIGMYLWNTISSYIEQYARQRAITKDAALMIIHVTLSNILKSKKVIETKHQWLKSDTSLNKFATYKEWKELFITEFIKPIEENLERECNRAEELIKVDKTNVIMELHKPESIEDATHDDVCKLGISSTVWQYQPRICVESLRKFLEEEGKTDATKQFKVLALFLQEEPVLTAMVHLPDIIRLQRLLIDKFHRCIDATEAMKVTPDQRGDEEQQLMVSFITAWNQVRGEIQVKHELKNRLELEACKLDVFLPTSTGEGVRSTELVKFLIQKHNQFLKEYSSIVEESKNHERRFIPQSNVTCNHLVAYDLNKHLIPLIHAHCHHSLQHSTLSFNLANLERAIEDHYIRGRPRISEKAAEFFFREGYRNERIFLSVREKVLPQEKIPPALRQEILDELRDITDLCDCLSVIDIAIGFLVLTTHVQSDMLISDYIDQKLHLPKEQCRHLKSKARHCRLRHILALWQLLAVERSRKRLGTRNKQLPFEGFTKDYYTSLTNEEEIQLEAALHNVDVEEFVGELYEYIELKLRATATGDLTNVEENSLIKNLLIYIRDKKTFLYGLDKMSELVTYDDKKAISTWVFAVKPRNLSPLTSYDSQHSLGSI